MTDHLHMIVGANEGNKVSDIMRDFKKFTSKEILRVLKADIQESRREWMLNPFEYASRNDKEITNYRFWQVGKDTQEIFLQDYFNQKLNYIHQNPVRSEMVNNPEHYTFSSATNYADKSSLIDLIFLSLWQM